MTLLHQLILQRGSGAQRWHVVHRRPHQRPGQRAGRCGEDTRSGVRQTRSKPSPNSPSPGPCLWLCSRPLGLQANPQPGRRSSIPLQAPDSACGASAEVRRKQPGSKSQVGEGSRCLAPLAPETAPLRSDTGPQTEKPGPHRRREGCPRTGCSEHPHSPAPEPPRPPEQHPLPTGAWLARLGLTH